MRGFNARIFFLLFPFPLFSLFSLAASSENNPNPLEAGSPLASVQSPHSKGDAEGEAAASAEAAAHVADAESSPDEFESDFDDESSSQSSCDSLEREVDSMTEEADPYAQKLLELVRLGDKKAIRSHIETEDEKKQYALDICLSYVSLISKTDMIPFLVEMGANPNVKLDSELSLIMNLVEDLKPKLFDSIIALFQCGVNPKTALNEYGESLLEVFSKAPSDFADKKTFLKIRDWLIINNYYSEHQSGGSKTWVEEAFASLNEGFLYQLYLKNPAVIHEKISTGYTLYDEIAYLFFEDSSLIPKNFKIVWEKIKDHERRKFIQEEVKKAVSGVKEELKALVNPLQREVQELRRALRVSGAARPPRELDYYMD